MHSLEQIRLVFCGKFLNNNQTLQGTYLIVDVLKLQEVLKVSQEGTTPTVHVVVKREQPQVISNKNQSPADLYQV